MTHQDLDWIWTGDMALRGVVPVARASLVPRLELGKPAWWDEPVVLGTDWMPPSGAARYGLARFAVGLDLDAGGTLTRMDFKVGLKGLGRGDPPTFFDLYPRSITEAHAGTVKAGLGPEVTVPGGAGFKLAQVEATETLQWVAPAVTARGIGRSQARWRCEARDTRPLAGQHLFYAVVELPPGVVAARVTVDVVVEARSGPALVRVVLPPKAEAAIEHWQLPPG
jgi:hypothetical protein